MDGTEPRVAFSIPQAVQASGVGRSSLYKAIAKGELKARKAGRRTIILAEDLNGWLRELPTWIPLQDGG